VPPGARYRNTYISLPSMQVEAVVDAIESARRPRRSTLNPTAPRGTAVEVVLMAGRRLPDLDRSHHWAPLLGPVRSGPVRVRFVRPDRCCLRAARVPATAA
jgi:hypothetical protein